MNQNQTKRMEMHRVLNGDGGTGLDTVEKARELANLAIDNIRDGSGVYRQGDVPLHIIADGLLENALRFHASVRAYENRNPEGPWEGCWLTGQGSKRLQEQSLGED